MLADRQLFRAMCELLWPSSPFVSGSEFLKISERNSYHFSSGGKPVPQGILCELCAEIHRRLIDQVDLTPALAAVALALAPEAIAVPEERATG